MGEVLQNFIFAMVLGIVVTYMVLAAQFESFIHPFTIMLSLPLGIVGALGGLLLTGKTINIFSGIGIIILIGAGNQKWYGVPTENQAEKDSSSCEAQEGKIRAFIESQNNWKVLKVYSDPGYTGANLDPPALKIPSYKDKVGRQWRFKRSEIDEWVERKGKLRKAK